MCEIEFAQTSGGCFSDFWTKNKIDRRVGISILAGVLASLGTSAHASTSHVQLSLKNTIPVAAGGTAFIADSNTDGYISEFLDHALPLGSPGTAITRSQASANLASGSLHAYASAQTSSSAIAYAEAAFHEVLTFAPNPGVVVSGNDWITADISMSVHAIKSAFTGLTNAPNSTFAGLSYFGAGQGMDQLQFGDPEVNGQTQIQHTLILNDVKIYHPLYNHSEEIHLSASLRALANASRYNQYLVNGEYFAQFDASNTAFISIDLPEGFGFVSDSGLFLTSPVPVPAAVWLFGTGLLGFIGVSRKNKVQPA